MKKAIFISLLSVLAFVATGVAQTPDSSGVPEKVPVFKTGVAGWIRFLELNLERDLLAKNNAPLGKYTVISSFIVETDGSVSDIQIESDRGYGTADEVKRVLLLSSKQWVPAYDKGQPVPYRHRQSITFVRN